MSNASFLRWGSGLIVGVAMVWGPAVLRAADAVKGAGKCNPQEETVEVFAALQAGQLEATLIAKDASQACLQLHNKTDRPLNVRLPAALGGVPVLAQFNFPFPPNGAANQGNAENSPQPLGLGNPLLNLGNNLPGNQRNGPGPNFAVFSIAPEKVAQLRLPGVCLQHGWPDPKPQIAYELRPLESVTGKPAVYELCVMLARGEIRQRVAQAAAWHLNNDMSWKTLKAERLRFAFGGLSEPYFSKRELADAEKAVATAIERAGAKPAATSDSLSMK